MLFKILIALNLFIIIYFLMQSASFLLAPSNANHEKLVQQLTKRIQFSLLCFIIIILMGFSGS